jgi:hypothetical protein
MCLDKRIVIVLIFLEVCTFFLSAEAPELRNVMPNSWKKVTRLTVDEETEFLGANTAITGQIKETLADAGFQNDYPKPSFFFVYKQQTVSGIFYRILCAEQEEPVFSSGNTSFFQALVLNRELLFIAGYRVVIYTSRPILSFASIDVIEGKSGVKGILLSSMLTRIDDGYALEEPIRLGDAGGNDSHYFLMEDIEKSRDFKEIDRYLYGRYTNWDDIIMVSASACLIDPNIPLRYSLQNAFDGDPATSYVENTGDDLIVVQATIAGAKKLAIINGYAQTSFLYYANNRIKSLVWPIKIDFSDDMLNYQFADVPHGQEIKVNTIYKGNKYNDTCIAELNLKTEIGWLFGDINEQ